MYSTPAVKCHFQQNLAAESLQSILGVFCIYGLCKLSPLLEKFRFRAIAH